MLVFDKQRHRMADLSQQISQQDALLEEMHGKNYNDIPLMEKEIREYDQMIGQVSQIVPDFKDTPGLFVDFYTRVKENRLAKGGITFSELKAEVGYSTFSVKLQVEGLPEDVYSFVEGLKDYKRAANITTLSFVPGEGGVITCDIEMQLYVMHTLKPDPLDYPFMVGGYGVKKPMDMFTYPQPEMPALDKNLLDLYQTLIPGLNNKGLSGAPAN
ncbi:MAG: type 4a pilus biogenesis protein PilO [Desulfocucumaceae bacterium]